MSIKCISEVVVVGVRGLGAAFFNRAWQGGSQGTVVFWHCCGFESKSNKRGLGRGWGGRRGRWVCRTGLCRGYSPSDGSAGQHRQGGREGGGTAAPARSFSVRSTGGLQGCLHVKLALLKRDLKRTLSCAPPLYSQRPPQLLAQLQWQWVALRSQVLPHG